MRLAKLIRTTRAKATTSLFFSLLLTSGCSASPDVALEPNEGNGVVTGDGKQMPGGDESSPSPFTEKLDAGSVQTGTDGATPAKVPSTSYPDASSPPRPTEPLPGTSRNLFGELLGKSESETTAKINATWNSLFAGDKDQRVYYEVGNDSAYIKDVASNDVRTEGMSYGMMIAVQLDKHAEFDKLWRWAATNMRVTSGSQKGYFAWHCDTAGKPMDNNPASDGEEYFATALLFAAARWGNGTGLLDYRAQAQSILDVMAHSGAPGAGGTPMFDPTSHQVVFVPIGQAATFTDPSYHLPAFYGVWAKSASRENTLWKTVEGASRAFLKTTVHSVTGLTPDYANFDGTPRNDGNHADFRFDAWRTVSNIAVDYAWSGGADPWGKMECERVLKFFAGQGAKYGNEFTLDGKVLSSNHSPGLVAMNAVAGLAANPTLAKPFVQELWDLPVPSGQYRYYDGMLYAMGVLHVAGRFRPY
jgi:endo-1,4-beta-D-glucanase Y